MDTKDAGRRGGLKTAKRGKAYYQRIGRKGGKKKAANQKARDKSEV